MIKLLSINLNILLKSNYCDQIIMMKLLLRNLNILLRSNYNDKNIVDKFEYFIKILL
jgi:hypothetical protein